MDFRLKDAFSFFRMGLVTGLVDIPALVVWADHQLMQSDHPPAALLELSLSAGRPYSELIWLLHGYERGADYNLSLKLLLAHAGVLLQQDASRAGEIIMGLRLLNEEEYFPKDVKAQICALRSDLDEYERGAITAAELRDRLALFLDPYAVHRALLGQTVQPPFSVCP